MRTLARWCLHHRLVVVATWLIAVIACTAVQRGVGSGYADNFSLPNTESAQVTRLLQRAAPAHSGDTDQLVIAVDHGRVTDPAIRARTETLIGRVARLPHVSGITSPYSARGAGQIAPSGRVAFATVNFNESAADLSTAESVAFDSIIGSASGHGVRFAAGGQVAEVGDPSGSSTAIPIGFLAAGAVLLIVFGTFPAMMLPLLTAAVSLGTANALDGLLSNVISMASFSSELALLIGLGVGVDYALFILTRYRQARLRGLEAEQAVLQALDTSGRAVLFAGVIVCVAMLGMMLLGVSFLYGVAIAAAITVAFTVLAALTLLPALLALFGERALRRGDRRAIGSGRFQITDESPAWRRWTAMLSRRPAAFALIAAAVMVALAAPLTSMRLGSTDAGSDPTGTTTHQAYELLARGFGPGYNGPLLLVAQETSPRQRAVFTHVVKEAARTPGVAGITSPSFIEGRDGRPGVALADVYPSGSPQAASTSTLLGTLRSSLIPVATRGTRLQVLVGGQTATFADFASVLTAKLPLFVAIVTLVAALLLMMVFRSLAVPLAGALMNLLTTGAALGVVTAVFQFGWLGGLLGVSPGPIVAFAPVLMFPILFGLSMDYEVFLLSRIYEEWHRRGDNREAVTHGLAATGRTITAAAVIMVLVFAAFVLGGQRIIELFGVGLASAVLLDAVIVRSVLVPGMMLLLGRANWHLPGFIERVLPQLRVEGELRPGPVLDSGAA